MAGKYTMRVEQGTTYRVSMAFTHDDDPYDFEGATVRMQVREQAGSPVLLTLSTPDGGIGFGDPGELNIELTSTQTAALRSGVYDIVATYPSGDVRRLMQGRVAVSASVTEGAA